MALEAGAAGFWQQPAESFRAAAGDDPALLSPRNAALQPGERQRPVLGQVVEHGSAAMVKIGVQPGRFGSGKHGHAGSAESKQPLQQRRPGRPRRREWARRSRPPQRR
eukprot:12184333-Alexandrium_andersonii.AAC.1